MRCSVRIGLPAVLLALLCASDACAQWLTQNISLHEGWNAVYLNVQPQPSACDTVLSGLPIDTVWRWERRQGLIEFDLDPGETFPRSGDWKVWFPESAPERLLSNFGDLAANEAYMIKVTAGTPDFVLSLKGSPLLSSYAWAGNAYNLFGLPVPESAPPTFTEFFASCPEIKTSFLDGGRIYTVDGAGRELLVYQPHRETIKRGQAYWILSGGITTYSGPLAVSLDNGGGQIDFGESTVSRTLRIRNATDAVRIVIIDHVVSETAPAGPEYPAVAGRVPLSYGAVNWDPAVLAVQYKTLPDTFQTNIAPSQALELRLRPQPSALTSPSANTSYQSILKISDRSDAGKTVLSQSIGVRFDIGDRLPCAPEGLWVGQVSVTGVNRARIGSSTGWDTDTIRPVGEPFTFRVIINVSSNGEAQLLQQAFIGWMPAGEVAVEGMDKPYRTVTTSVMFTEAEAETFLSAHPGSKVRRISSVNFPLINPVAMTGSFGETNNIVGSFTMDYRDPVNPFVHKFHPDHDNQEYRNDVPVNLPEGVESYTIARRMVFSFSGSDRNGSVPAGWGIDRCGGTYAETVEGLHSPIKTEGWFELTRVLEEGR